MTRGRFDHTPPGTTIFDRYPIPTLKPSNLAIVAKVDTLNRQGQTINTHRAPTQSPKFFSRAIYSNCSVEFYSIYQVDWQQPDVPSPPKKKEQLGNGLVVGDLCRRYAVY